ncbi:MAG: EamA family transporter [Specibacter sp.]
MSLAVLLMLFEGLPASPLSGSNILGYLYLSVAGTAFAYFCWFRALARLPAGAAVFLGLLSPVVAMVLGWWVAGQSMGPWQLAGIAVVLVSVIAGVGMARLGHGTGKPQQEFGGVGGLCARGPEICAAQSGDLRRRAHR